MAARRVITFTTMIHGLAGVLIYTAADHFPAMRDFYVRVLGLEPRSDRSGFVNFEWGGQRLTVATHSDIRAANPSPLHVMINLSTNDIGEIYSAAVARGARSIRAPERESWGGWVATLADPDGNVVQLLQFPGNES